MKSFRLIFIDVDESFTTSTVEAPIKGYIVCRAPKGTTEAMYFPYGNKKTINAMIGLETANWPDLYEAIAFNSEYGLYISAPPGTTKNYPSYYGGVYLTTKSMYNYWRVDDKDNPNYEVQLYPGVESMDFDPSIKNSTLEVEPSTSPNGQGTIKITGVDPSIIAKCSYINFDCWKQNSRKISEGTEVAYHLTNGKIYPVVDDEDQTDTLVGKYDVTSEGKYTITIGAAAGAINTTSSFGINFLNFWEMMGLDNKLEKITNNNVETGEISFKSDLRVKGTPVNDETHTGVNCIKYLLINGVSQPTTLVYGTESDSTNGEVTIQPFTGIKNRMYYRINIKDECFMRISQKSPNETPTSITISDIGYDKYLYDVNVKYVLKEDFEPTSSDGIVDSEKGIKGGSFEGDASFLQSLAASNDKYLLDVIAPDVVDNVVGSDHKHSLWQLNPSTGEWVDITSDYRTKNIFVSGPLRNSSYKSGSTNKEYYADVDTVDRATFTNTIWYIESAGKPGSYKHVWHQRTLDGTYRLQPDINYNTITLSCKEQVYPGSYMSGGDFMGSLSETGVAADGSNIYWPNVLSSSDASFIEVTPVHTFDELEGAMDSNGFFTGEKMVDPIGPAQDIKTFTIKGQRAITNAVQTNINAGTLGCAWTKNPLLADSGTTVESVFTSVIDAGLTEAQQTSYDDALIFMECSGQECFKPTIMSLRTVYHDTCTFISPKIITKSDFNKPETITVSGRSKGTAQYIGEFKMYDSYTGKYYWCQPIGDVGVNLARIMEKRLGGIAPAGTNDSSGLGGVLSRAVLDKKWDFPEETLRILDEKGLNPITYDPKNGLMMQSQKSTQDGPVTDWSYLGHSMSFDLCKREIRDKVMLDQLHKRINDYWYNIRTKQVQAILDKRITGHDPIWAEATVDIASVNNPKTKAQRKFMITVKVKVYPYSDYVVLTFTTSSQE
jgi:hypothetical protein